MISQEEYIHDWYGLLAFYSVRLEKLQTLSKAHNVTEQVEHAYCTAQAVIRRVSTLFQP